MKPAGVSPSKPSAWGGAFVTCCAWTALRGLPDARRAVPAARRVRARRGEGGAGQARGRPSAVAAGPRPAPAVAAYPDT
ncbi:hypothetical protein SSAG_01138 [Streptomyces sp. Mg1]|nr:hypothetical protein SSAG_01138 [Streptomyces sp. Mg1]